MDDESTVDASVEKPVSGEAWPPSESTRPRRPVRLILAAVLVVVLVGGAIWARSAWLNRLWGTWETSLLGFGSVQIEFGWRGQAAGRFSSPLGPSDVAVGTWKRDGDTITLDLEAALPFRDSRLTNVSVRGDTMEADYAGMHVEFRRVAKSLSPTK